MDMDDDSIDENALAVECKGDSGNLINDMLTDMYKKNNDAKKKSNLKQISMFDDAYKTIAPIDKKVHFENSNNNNNESFDPNNKRKLSISDTNSSNKNIKTDNMTNMEKLELLKQSNQKKGSSNNKKCRFIFMLFLVKSLFLNISLLKLKI